MSDKSASKNFQQLSLNLNLRYIALGLLVVIVCMLMAWRPWQSTKAGDRTVEVTGQATLSAKPDEFVFYPTYEFKNSDQQTALNEMTARNNTVVAKLKELGVADSKIKSNSDSWSYPVYMDSNESTPTYTLRLTVTVGSQELAQKVQDYLITTSPTGTISPQASFSDKKRKQLEDRARDEASKDARKKAEQSAENLGFRLSSVKTVNDGAGFGGAYASSQKDMALYGNTSSSLLVQPGENELSYTVMVTYFIK